MSTMRWNRGTAVRIGVALTMSVVGLATVLRSDAISPPTAATPTYTTVCPVAGSGQPDPREPTVDGLLATQTRMYQPRNVTADAAGNVYVIEGPFLDSRVRRIDAVTGIVTTLAGGGTLQNGTETDGQKVRLVQPIGLAVEPDGSALYFAEAGETVVRKVVIATHSISIVAGNYGESLATSVLGTITDIALFGTHLYVSDYSRQAVFHVDLTTPGATPTRFAGGGANGQATVPVFPGPGVPATSIATSQVFTVATDTAGAVYFVNPNDIVFRVDPATGDMTRFGGAINTTAPTDGALFTNSGLLGLTNLAFTASTLYISSSMGNKLWEVDLATRIINSNTLSAQVGYDDGPNDEARYAMPTDIAALPDGRLYIADGANNLIRDFNPVSGHYGTLAGIGPIIEGGIPGPDARSATLFDVSGVATDDRGGTYVADGRAARIYYVAADGSIRAFIGTGGRRNFPEAPTAVASTYRFGGRDSSTIEVTNLKYVNAINGNRYLFAMENSEKPFFTNGGGNRLVRIGPLDAADPPVVTIAGNDFIGRPTLGQPATSQPFVIADYDVDRDLNVYIADNGTARILEVPAATGLVTSIVGGGLITDLNISGVPGPAATASIGKVGAIALGPNGKIYYSAQDATVDVPRGWRGNRIFEVAGGNIRQIAGVGGNANVTFGDDLLAQRVLAHDLAVDANGILYTAEVGFIRRIDPVTGASARIFGALRPGDSSTQPATSVVAEPFAAQASDRIVQIDLAPDGSLYFADDFSENIKIVGFVPLPGPNRVRRLVANKADCGFGAFDSKLVPPAALAGGDYGQSVAVHGDTMVVSELRTSELDGRGFRAGATEQPGRVHVYSRGPNGWTLAQTIQSAAAAPGDRFGYSVAYDGNVLAVTSLPDCAVTGVGAPGRLEIYRKSAAGQFAIAQSFVGPTPCNGYGTQVVLAGDDLSVLAPDPAHAASVYTYRANTAGTFALATTLVAQHTGDKMAVEGALLAIADEKANTAALYTRTATGWAEAGQVDDPDFNPPTSLAVVQGRVIIGKGSMVEVAAPDSTGAYVVVQSITPTIRSSAGTALAAQGDMLYVSDDGAGQANQDGIVYRYSWDGVSYGLQGSYTPPDPRVGIQADGLFGNAIAVDGTTLVAGSVTGSGLIPTGGAAYVFDVPAATLDPKVSVAIASPAGSPNTVAFGPIPTANLNPSFIQNGGKGAVASTSLASVALDATDAATAPLSSIPLSSIPLAGSGLDKLALSDIDLRRAGGWVEALKAGGAPAGLLDAPLQNITLGQALPYIGTVKLGEVSVQGTALGSVPLSSIALGSVPLSSIGGIDWCAELLRVHSPITCGNGVNLATTTVFELAAKGVPLSSIPLSSIPLSSIPLSSIPLSSIPLSSIVAKGAPLSSIPLSSIPLSSIKIAGTPLSSIPLSSIALARTPLSSIPLSATRTSAAAIHADWCGLLAGSRLACPAGDAAIDAHLASIPLSSIPLSSIPLSSIPLSSIPLSSIPVGSLALASSPLSSIPLSSIPLSSIPLSAIPLSSIPLSSIPLSSIPLSSIAIKGSPLSSIPLSSIPLSSIPLSSIPLSSIPLSSIPLSSIPLSSISVGATPLSSIPLSSIDLLSTPLSSIPLSSIPLSSIGTVVDCSRIDCALGSLGDALRAGALRDTAKLADLGAALTGIRLSALVGTNPTLTEDALRAAVDGVNLSLGQLANLDNLALGDLPANLAGVRDTLLGQLASALGNVRVDDLASILLDANGQPRDPAVVRAQLRSAIDTYAQTNNVKLGDLGTLGNIVLADLVGTPAFADLHLDSLGFLLGLLHLDDLVGVNGITEAELTTARNQLTQTLGQVANLGDMRLADLAGLAGQAALTNTQIGQVLQLVARAWLINYTLGDLLLASVDQASLPAAAVDFTGATGADIGTAAPGVDFDITFRTQDSSGADLEVVADLPAGYGYAPGSATIDRPVTGSLEPTVNGSRLTWRFRHPADFADHKLRVTLRPSPSLGTDAIAVSARLVGTTATASGTGQVTVAEGFETNNDPATATPLQPRTVYLTTIPTATDVDVYKFDIGPNPTRVRVDLANLGADLDVVLYRKVDPVVAANQPLTGVDAAVPLTSVTDPAADAPVPPEATNDFPRFDLTDPTLKIVGLANQRGLTPEAIVTDELPAGTYYVQVHGANGASSPRAATLTVQTSAKQPAPACAATPLTGSPANGATATVTDANATALIVVNERRMEQLYGAAGRATVTAAVQRLVTFLNANPALEVKPAVVSVDANVNVRSAYAAWDAAPCSVAAADDVVRSIIANVVTPARAVAPKLRHLVIVGGDDVIPMARVDDETKVSNEYDFRNELDPAVANRMTALTSVFWNSKVLTDEPYGDSNAIPVEDRYLYVSELALGRLVETPTEIARSLDSFVGFNGVLAGNTALATSYDFLDDGADDVVGELRGVLGTTPVDATLAGKAGTETWTSANLDAKLRTDPDLVSVNAHFDPGAALPAVGNNVANFGDNYLVSALDAMPATVLNGSIAFSMGCHAGLSVSDIQIGSRDRDWAQAFAQRGGQWIANTGYGYGDTATVAYSEKLMALFSHYLVHPIDLVGRNRATTIGEAMMFARQAYLSQLGTLSVYDEKALMEATFYGLPFFRVNLPSAPGEPAPTNDPTTDLFTGQPSLTLTVTPTFVTDTTQADGTLFATRPAGTTDLSYQGAPGRPIQPTTVLDVSSVKTTDSRKLDEEARGAIVLGMTSTYDTGVDPIVSRAVVDSSGAQPEPDVSSVVYPAAPASITSYVAPEGERQSLVLFTGQFASDASGVTGTERLDTNVTTVVYYAPLGTADVAPPTIGRVESTVDPTTHELSFSVNASDSAPGTVARVYALVAENPGIDNTTVVWRGVDLVLLGGRWVGALALAPGTTNVEFLVQAVDRAGNVAVSSDKATYFQESAVVPPTPANDPSPDLSVAVSPAPASNGWNTTSTVTVTADAGSATVEFSVDGGPYGSRAGNAAPVTGDGIHTVDVRASNGQQESRIVRIDTATPTATIGRPVAAAVYEHQSNAGADFRCADPSLRTCVATLDGVAIGQGAPLTASVGSHTVRVTATDAFGNTAAATAAYTVLDTPSVGAIAVPGAAVLFGTAAPLSLTFVDNDGAGTYRVVWSFGDGTPPVTVTCAATATSTCGVKINNGQGTATTTHVYANPGVYEVTATVIDATNRSSVPAPSGYVVVYNPNGSFLTGSARYTSPAGAWRADLTQTGRADIGVSVRYKPNSTVPTGNVRVRLHDEDFELEEVSFEFLVVSGTTATVKGRGHLQDEGDYGFLISVRDGSPDQVRVKIWDAATGLVLYDTQPGAADTAAPTTPITQGQLQVKA